MVGQLSKINAVFPTQKSIKINAEVTKKFVNDFLVEKMAFIFDNWPTQKFSPDPSLFSGRLISLLSTLILIYLLVKKYKKRGGR